MGIGLSDIKKILNDKSVLKQILMEKKKEITILQNELEALEKFIENNNIEESQQKASEIKEVQSKFENIVWSEDKFPKK